MISPTSWGHEQVARESRTLFEFLEASEVGTIFALPWMITWFGHVLPDYKDVVRLYDFFLAQPPLMPVYLATALVLHRESEVMMTDGELASVFAILSRIPIDLPFEKLLVDAQDLYEKYPPKTLETDVATRIQRLKEINERARRVRGTLDRGFRVMPWAVTALIVAAPVIVGIVAWKFYHS